MGNFELQADEVILYEGAVSTNIHKGNLLITLTSQKIVLEREKGLFKKERELVDSLPLDEVKYYNDAPQVKQKGSAVDVQTSSENLTITFSGMIEARKFTGKIVDAVTGTTLAKRVSDKTKDVLHEQTKQGIIRDIEEYIEQNETVADLETWLELKEELIQDIQRRRNNGRN